VQAAGTQEAEYAFIDLGVSNHSDHLDPNASTQAPKNVVIEVQRAIPASMQQARDSVQS
jgi:hypothetical protein